MNEQEKEKFRLQISEFSTKQLLGWLSAISFIVMMPDASIDLKVKLHDMFDIIDDEFMKKIHNN